MTISAGRLVRRADTWEVVSGIWPIHRSDQATQPSCASQTRRELVFLGSVSLWPRPLGCARHEWASRRARGSLCFVVMKRGVAERSWFDSWGSHAFVLMLSLTACGSPEGTGGPPPGAGGAGGGTGGIGASTAGGGGSSGSPTGGSAGFGQSGRSGSGGSGGTSGVPGLAERCVLLCDRAADADCADLDSVGCLMNCNAYVATVTSGVCMDEVTALVDCFETGADPCAYPSAPGLRECVGEVTAVSACTTG